MAVSEAATSMAVDLGHLNRDVEQRTQTLASSWDKEFGLVALHGAICERLGYDRRREWTELRSGDFVHDTTPLVDLADGRRAQLGRIFTYDTFGQQPGQASEILETWLTIRGVRADKADSEDYDRTAISKLGDLLAPFDRVSISVRDLESRKKAPEVITEQAACLGALKMIASEHGIGRFRQWRIQRAKPLGIAPVVDY